MYSNISEYSFTYSTTVAALGEQICPHIKEASNPCHNKRYENHQKKPKETPANVLHLGLVIIGFERCFFESRINPMK